MRNLFYLCLFASSSAVAGVDVTHNVLVKQGFSVDGCAREIQTKTTADVLEIMNSIGVISIKSSDREAIRVANLLCVDAVEKNGLVGDIR